MIILEKPYEYEFPTPRPAWTDHFIIYLLTTGMWYTMRHPLEGTKLAFQGILTVRALRRGELKINGLTNECEEED